MLQSKKKIFDSNKTSQTYSLGFCHHHTNQVKNLPDFGEICVSFKRDAATKAQFFNLINVFLGDKQLKTARTVRSENPE